MAPWLGKDKPPPLARDDGLRKRVPASARRAAADRPGDRGLRWACNGERPEPVPSYLGPVEDPEDGKLGICCSGGGIRSAAFSLGALQVLGEGKQLREASYLAAVSGGSYIAAALSTVARTGDGESDEELIEDMPPFAQGSPEEQYLRNRCSYMAPTAADKLYVGTRIVLGLLINLAFISLPLVGAALVLTGVLYAPYVSELAGSTCSGDECAALIPASFWIAPLAVLGLGGLFGLATLLFRWRAQRWERFFVTWTSRLTVLALALAVVLVGLPYLVDWLDGLADAGDSVKPSVPETLATIGTGFLALVGGAFAQLGRLLSAKDGEKEAAKDGEKAVGWTRKAAGKAGSGFATGLAFAAGGLIGPLLVLAVVALAIMVGMSEAPGVDGQEDWAVFGVGAGAIGLFLVFYYLADLTTWSLHPFYKRRLSSAFALKRVRAEGLDKDERERVEYVVPGAGADAGAVPAAGEPEIGVAIERDYDKLVPLSKTALREREDQGRRWPTLLVCAAANVSDPGASPPGRPVTSFTFSAGTVGGPLVGAVPMSTLERAFEDDEEADKTEATLRVSEEDVVAKVESLVKVGVRKHRRRDLTLPAAVAMSGAAVSPSMGKMTPRPLTFLMALANIRLGVWVANPRWVAGYDDDEALPRRYARPRPSYLFRELLGRNRVDAKYLYVSDGGHYENLGLVELLRRGCTRIYCFDASGVGRGKAEFDALGEAIALARSELRVEVDFPEQDLTDLEPDPETGLAEKDVIRGRIRYGGEFKGVEGRLIYVRNTMTAEASWDARAHQRVDPRFPRNSTVDQLYTDQKFEAYRVLGAGAARRAVREMEA